MLDWDRLPAVAADLTFIGDEVNGVAEFHKAPEIPPDRLPHVTRTVAIHDARAVAGDLSLEREGFAVADFDDGQPDYADPDQVRRIWVPAVQALLKAQTGASHVYSWAVGSRFSSKLPESQRNEVSAPARMVHSDFSPAPLGLRIDNRPASAVVADLVGSDRPRRWKAYNVWQAVSPPPHDTPLALCDASSEQAENFVSAQGRATYENGVTVEFELSWVKHSPRQRWAYFEDLRPNEALIFCGLDMAAGPLAQRVAHAAFANPTAPPDAPPRRSMEIRNIVVWDD